MQTSAFRLKHTDKFRLGLPGLTAVLWESPGNWRGANFTLSSLGERFFIDLLERETERPWARGGCRGTSRVPDSGLDPRTLSQSQTFNRRATWGHWLEHFISHSVWWYFLSSLSPEKLKFNWWCIFPWAVSSNQGNTTVILTLALWRLSAITYLSLFGTLPWNITTVPKKWPMLILIFLWSDAFLGYINRRAVSRKAADNPSLPLKSTVGVPRSIWGPQHNKDKP